MIYKQMSLADQVYRRLESEILTGKYARGEILTEMRLVKDLDVSRTPIREAIRLLEQEHVVEMTGRGIVVLGVTMEDLADIYDVRLRIEPVAAARAARYATAQEVDALREALELQEYYVGRADSDNIKTQDSRFHELLYRGAHSMVYLDVLFPLHRKAQKYRKISVENRSRADASVTEHRAVYDAIAAHKDDAAERAMRAHIENAARHILGTIPS